MRRALIFAIPFLILLAVNANAQWGKPATPAIAEADGYASIPNAAVQPDKKRVYKAVFDATRAATDPAKLLPALNMAGSELNAFAVEHVPPANVKFVVVFHGPAVDGILNEAAYKAKFGIANPNLKVLSEMKKAGVAIYVCGQHLIAENIDPATLSRDVTVASDALIVLMSYENDGYALLSF